MDFLFFSPGTMTVNVASAGTFVADGSTDVAPAIVAVTVPPAGVPSTVLRGGARSSRVAPGARPVRLAGVVVGFSDTQRPDSQPWCAASTALSCIITAVIRPHLLWSLMNASVTPPPVRSISAR